MSDKNYHRKSFCLENLLAIELKKNTIIQIFMNKLEYLSLSILELSKIVINEFWYHYVKAKYRVQSKLCYVDTCSFIVYIKTEDIYADFPKDIETIFLTSNYELERALLK